MPARSQLSQLQCILLLACSTGAFAFQAPLILGLRPLRNGSVQARRHGNTTPRMVLDGGLPMDNIFEIASAAPSVAGMMYQKAFSASPASIDSLTGMGLYYLGQRTKGVIGHKKPTMDVLARWMTIGLADGFISHEWYSLLEFAFSPLGLSHWNEVAAMAAVTSILFTPIYCAAFLGGLSLLEGKGLRGTADRLQREYAQMLQATISTWGVFNIALFGLVDIDHRVTVAMAAHYLYIIALALWTDRTAIAAALESSAPANLLQEENGAAEHALRLAVPFQAEEVPPLDGAEVTIV